MKSYAYISTGEKAGFYTLWISEYVGRGSYRDLYIKNLTVDKDQVQEKAREALKAINAEDFEIHDDDFHLNEIKRRTDAQILADIMAEIETLYETGTMPFGKYKDTLIANIPLDYRTWFVESINEDSNLLSAKIAELMDREGDVSEELERRRKEREKIEIKKAASEYVGEIGTRQDFELKCNFITSFVGYYGTNWLFIFEDKDENTFKYLGSSCLEVEQGQTCVLTGTIKAHDEYKGEKQTVINRPKLKEVLIEEVV